MTLLAFTHLQLLDSALPIGAFAHSWGLEAAVDEGVVRTADELAAYASGLLHARWAPTDARLVAAVHELAEAGELERLWHVATLAHASNPASRSRDGSAAIGRRLLRLLPELHPALDLTALVEAVAAGDAPALHPLVHGWATWQLGVPREEAALGWLFAAVTACVQAAVRLMSLGQTDAQRVVTTLLAELEPAWCAVASGAPEQLASAAVQGDVWAMRQPRLEGRLFMS